MGPTPEKNSSPTGHNAYGFFLLFQDLVYILSSFGLYGRKFYQLMLDIQFSQHLVSISLESWEVINTRRAKNIVLPPISDRVEL